VAPDEAVLANEIQILLAEKRTALSVMRTALAMLAIPLSVASILIATSRYYDASAVMPLLVPVLLVSLGLTLLAAYLILRSLHRLHVVDRKFAEIKATSLEMAKFVVE